MGKDWKAKGPYGASAVFEYPLKFQYRGKFDYDGLMNVIRSYFASVKIEKLDEPKFKYKVSGGKAEVEFKLEGEMKATAYTKIKLVVEGHLWNVVRSGLTDGKLELKIQSSYLYDYSGSFNQDSKVEVWMQKKIHKPKEGKGIAFNDLKSEGKKNAEKMGNSMLAQIKKFIGVECT